jgi:hypothetical protein
MGRVAAQLSFMAAEKMTLNLIQRIELKHD